MGDSKRLQAGSILPWCAQDNGEELLAEQKWPHGQCMKQSDSFKLLGQGLDPSHLMLDELQFLTLLSVKKSLLLAPCYHPNLPVPSRSNFSSWTKQSHNRRFWSHGEDSKFTFKSCMLSTEEV